jgi:hypothetical protein
MYDDSNAVGWTVSLSHQTMVEYLCPLFFVSGFQLFFELCRTECLSIFPNAPSPPSRCGNFFLKPIFFPLQKDSIVHMKRSKVTTDMLCQPAVLQVSVPNSSTYTYHPCYCCGIDGHFLWARERGYPKTMIHKKKRDLHHIPLHLLYIESHIPFSPIQSRHLFWR